MIFKWFRNRDHCCWHVCSFTHAPLCSFRLHHCHYNINIISIIININHHHHHHHHHDHDHHHHHHHHHLTGRLTSHSFGATWCLGKNSRNHSIKPMFLAKGGEQNSHRRGRICAEIETTADGRSPPLVGRKTFSWDHDAWIWDMQKGICFP